MLIKRGEIWWADLPDPDGSRPALTRPVLVIQSDVFNQSAIQTVMVALLSSNPKLANMPGNIWLETEESKLPKDSVINVSQVYTFNKNDLRDYVSTINRTTLELLDDGLRLILNLSR